MATSTRSRPAASLRWTELEQRAASRRLRSLALGAAHCRARAAFAARSVSTLEPANRPLRGIVCMVAGVVLIVASDATAKWLTQGYPVTEVVALRGLVVMVLIVAGMAWRRELRLLVPRNRRGHAVRAGFAVGSSYCFIGGVSLVPLADATAGAMSGPLFAAALSAPLLGERVGWRRWLAVVIGFVGVVVMLRPGAGGLALAMLLPVAAAFFGAVRDLVTRRISVTESSNAILLTSNAAIVGIGLVAGTVMLDWRVPSAIDFAMLCLSAALIGGAQLLHIEAFRYAEAGTLGPFRYTSLVWAALIGFLVWGDVPGLAVLLGALLVAGSGLYVLRLSVAENRGAAPNTLGGRRSPLSPQSKDDP